MFLCPNCHPSECRQRPWEPLSRGLCEVCGNFAGCSDCSYMPPLTPEQDAGLEAMMKDLEAKTTYEVSFDSGATWETCTVDEFMEAERSAGFFPKTPGHPATGGFSNGRLQGRQTYNG